MRATGALALLVSAALGLTGCGQFGAGQSGPADGDRTPSTVRSPDDIASEFDEGPRPRNTIFELLNRGDAENTVQVNRYIWAASLEVLDFLPIQSVDPFTGVIVTGYGTPPGSGRSYRATVLVDDPALDARSLKVSMQSRSGPVNASTVRAIEDAILTRARQLRVADSRL